MPKVKRCSKIIHPNSRKALELASKEHHKCRNARSNEKTKGRANVLIKKIVWFKEQISAVESEQNEMEVSDKAVEEDNFRQKVSYTIEDIHALIDLYFHRFDDEIEQINTKKSIGKRSIGQSFSREKSIEMTIQSEKHEYETSGLIVPDLTNIENVKLLRAWNEQQTHLQTIKLKTIKKI